MRFPATARMRLDIERVTAAITEVAATEILPRFERLAAHEVREKAPGDVVTVADERAEARLAPLLTSLAPGSLVVGEEAVAADLAVLELLSHGAPVWLIDPIDGTSNFAEGVPRFAVMVAFVRGDRVAAGWIHDPINRTTAVAERGSGAWLDGERLRVAAGARVTDMSGVLLAGCFGDPALGRRIQQRRHRVRAEKSLRCAGLEYVRLARGAMHFGLFTKLMPWDHAPGVLIHAEAGGHSGYLEGGAYDPARIRASGLLVAPDADSWAALRSALFDP